MEKIAEVLLPYGPLGAVCAILFAMVIWQTRTTRQDMKAYMKSNESNNSKWRETVREVADQHNETLQKSMESMEKTHELAGEKIALAVERALLERDRK